MDATRYKFFVIKSLLFVLFVSYIGLSARMLSYFNCTPVYEELYLTADLNIRCFAGLHAACLPLAVLGLLLYPIGVPATFVFLLVWYRVPQIARMKHSAYLLHLARQQLQDPGRCRELQDMDPIVGGIAFYGEGSSSQLLVAAAICFSAICINLSVRADTELAVHIFTTATNFVLLIILALALALLDDDSDAELIDQLLVWPILL
eukprot:gene29568-36844_t